MVFHTEGCPDDQQTRRGDDFLSRWESDIGHLNGLHPVGQGCRPLDVAFPQGFLNARCHCLDLPRCRRVARSSPPTRPERHRCAGWGVGARLNTSAALTGADHTRSMTQKLHRKFTQHEGAVLPTEKCARISVT